jgi:uncharacterized protein YvpB
MKRFMQSGGGILALLIKGEIVFAIITNFQKNELIKVKKQKQKNKKIKRTLFLHIVTLETKC